MTESPFNITSESAPSGANPAGTSWSANDHLLHDVNKVVPAGEIVESRATRDRLVARVEALDKVKALRNLWHGTRADIASVAGYFEVGVKAIESVIFDHRSELEADGLDVLTGERLSSFKKESGYTSRAGSLTLLPRRAILRIGMLLRDSVVAQAVRTELLDVEEKGTQIVSTPGGDIALPDLTQSSPDVIAFVGRLGEAAATASRTALVAMQQVQQLEAARAEEAPLVEQARHHRSTRALTAIGDFANDLQAWVRDEGINAHVLHDDVRDYLGYLKLIIRGNTVRNNCPQAEAIKAGYVRPHNHDFGTSARLTRKGVGYAWDRITPHIKATGSAKPPAPEQKGA